MRPIKFRIRDTKRNEWYRSSDPSSLPYTGTELFGETMMQPIPLDDLQYLEVDQFTGLHDSNGVEIYENDLIKITYPSGTDDENIHIVSYTEDRFATYPIKEGQIVYTLATSLGITDIKYKITGNIYQNKDLLNK